MSDRSTLAILAPLLFGAAFAGHLVNVLVIEPALGFASPEDFYDADRFLPLVGHPVWLLGAFYHFAVGAAVLMLALGADTGHRASPYTRTFGVAACVLFVLVGLSNIAGLRELGAIASLTDGDAQAMHGAFLVVRAVLLSGAVLFLGLFLVAGNAARVLAASTTTARYVGMFAGVAFVLVPLLPPVTPAALLSAIAWGVFAGLVGFRKPTS